MLVFLAVVIVMIGLVLVSILPAILRSNTGVKKDNNIERREIFSQQFAEIEQDKTIGVLDDKQYNIAKSELERRMLEEVGTTQTSAAYVKPDKRLAIMLSILIPVLSLWLYVNIGRPIAMLPPEVLQAMQQNSEREMQASANAQSSASSAMSDVAIEGTVSIAPALASKVDPEMTIYIFARATQGQPMPLAIVKTKVKDLPYRYHLDDSNGLMPTLKLSQASEVVVVARVATGGDAKAQAGDLEGVSEKTTISETAKPAGQIVNLEINHVVE